MDLNELGRKPEAFNQKESVFKGISGFFSQKEANFFGSVGREITEKILRESFLLYRIDINKTRVHKLYAEAKIKNYLPEVEIFGRINVEVLDPSQQVSGGITKKGFGNLTASIYAEQLEELGLLKRKGNNEFILGIRQGDFIGFKGHFYEIYDDGFAQISNQHSWASDRRFSITISAKQVDNDIFKAR